MKQNKGIILILVLLVILIVSVIGGDAFSGGKNQNNAETSTPQQPSSCLVITSPVVNQTVSFPLTITGYVDVAGAQAETCTRWGIFEGTAGTVVVKDTNGNVRSLETKIQAVNDYYEGMQQWPVTATIESLTSVPYSDQIILFMTADEQQDGVSPATQTLQPFTVTPYP